jgi:hypothetical protein
MSFESDVTGGSCYGCFVRATGSPPFTLEGLIAAGLVDLQRVEPTAAINNQATGNKQYRARYSHTWTEADAMNPPRVLAAFHGDPPDRLLFALPYAFPAGYIVRVGDTVTIPLFFNFAPDGGG